MSAYYDLLEKPDIRRTGEQQPLYARFVAKGTIDRKDRSMFRLNAMPVWTGIGMWLVSFVQDRQMEVISFR